MLNSVREGRENRLGESHDHAIDKMYNRIRARQTLEDSMGHTEGSVRHTIADGDSIPST